MDLARPDRFDLRHDLLELRSQIGFGNALDGQDPVEPFCLFPPLA